MSVVDDGFRLAGTPSEWSVKSKARIDALFEDTKSVCSSTLGGWYASVNFPAMTFPNLEKISAEEQKRVNNAVQARIEAMFASVEAETRIPGESSDAILPVRYLGAAPVGGRIASVRGLQEPLRDLLGRFENSLPAELEVSRHGLTFRTSDSMEKTNPFRRIAVWSALKLRSKKLPSGDLQYAFLPLVGEDAVYSSGDAKHADLYRTMRGLKREARCSPPIFAVVMRRPGIVHLLECHAFICQVEEDAIAAAAILYRALLADLDGNRRRPTQANGVGCVSLGSVASFPSNVSITETSPTSLLGPPPPRPTAPHPVRPPRIKKNSLSGTKDGGNSSSSGLENTDRRKNVTEEAKAESILEGRSRRPSIVSSIAIPPSLEIENKLHYDSSSQKVLQENNKNSYLCTKSTISIISTQENDWNHKNQNQREIFDQVSRGDSYFKHRTRSDSYIDNSYEKMRTGQSKKLDNKNQHKDNTNFIVCNRDNREQSTKDMRPSSIGVEQATGKRRESYSWRKGEENIVPSKKQGYQNYKSSISDENNSQNGRIYSQKNRGRLNDLSEASKHEGKGKLYTEPFEDTKKSFRSNQKTDYQNGTSRCSPNSVHMGRVAQDRESGRVIDNQSVKNFPKMTTLNESSIMKTTEYSQPKIRKSSRASSEPPRTDNAEDWAFSTNKNQENRLKKAQSDLDLDGGDLLTRVELPRRGSFLHSSSTRKPENFQGGTPLGFTELFDEFRNQEGLTSVDDILAAIIDPEGMSFNDLKPLYKEFLLKLAATLTRDELYERSASIMRRRRRPQRSRAPRRPCLLGRAIKRSVSRLRTGPTEFTSVIFPARKLNDSLGSSSSCDARNARNRVIASKLGRRRCSRRRKKTAIGHTTSEDSDTCRRFSSRGIAANRSSSGYVSCSECSYDSESCTCVSADKCYCSLSRRVSTSDIPVATVLCSCDTDSCSESNKCYCARKLPVRQPTILEQLRQRGIVPSESTLSRADSPQIIRTSKTNKSYASSRSLEFLKARPRVSSSENFALDYDLFNLGENPQSTSSNSDKVLVVGARDSQGRLIYVGGTGRGKRTPANDTGRSSTHHEALSIKKSAEIAAVFSNSVKMARRASNASSLKSSASLEAGLGYLP